MLKIDPEALIIEFYPVDDALRRMLLKHSRQVAIKALAIGHASGKQLDWEVVETGALLHDIGIGQCHAPGIFCTGTEPYIAHGLLGGALLRTYGAAHQMDLEIFARICERHTGSGLTKLDIVRQHLPLPPQDFLPETPEEKLICLADKYYSKSGDMLEKTLPKIRSGMLKFGPESLERFDALCAEFQVK